MTSEELRKLADEATPGPWIIDNPGIDGEDGIGAILMGPTGEDEYGRPAGYDDFIETDGGCYGPRFRNARLIALAPDLARLCADAFDYLAEEREGWAEEGAVEVPRLDALLAKLSELEPR